MPAPTPTLAILALLAPAALAQPEWSPRFAFTGFHRQVLTLATHDFDGPGPRPELLYAGGWFDEVSGLDCHGLAAWNGKGWAPVPDCPIDVWRFLGAERGTGRLLMTGEADPLFTEYLHAWDGDSFEQLGEFSGAYSGNIFTMTYWDPDGGGPAQPVMVVGGDFTRVQGKGYSRLAAWDGAQWTEFAGGAHGNDFAGVLSLISWDMDGDGPDDAVLIAAGEFDWVGKQQYSVPYLAAWNGGFWGAPGGGVDGLVFAAALFDDDGDGPGLPALYIAGTFTHAGDEPVEGLARFDGENWSAVGPPSGRVYSLQALDLDGSGPQAPRLVAAGQFSAIGGTPVHNAAAWDGSAWVPLGDNLAGHENGNEMAVYDSDGPGPEIGQVFSPTPPEDSPFDSWHHYSIARLEADSWRELASGVTSSNAFTGVWSIVDFDPDPQDEQSPALVLAGNIDRFVQTWDGDRQAGTGLALCCNEWNWPIGPYVFAAATYDQDGPGPGAPQVVIGGWFEEVNDWDVGAVARWDGSAWTPIGSLGQYATVQALLSVDLDGGGPALPCVLAGGRSMHTVRWDGAMWKDFYAGIDSAGDPSVNALAALDPDGDGPAAPTVYAAGLFNLTDHPDQPNIARWDGARWQPLGGLDGAGLVLTSHDPDGPGPLPPVLVAGGEFAAAGGVPALHLAQWDGQAWAELGGGVGGPVRALASVPAGGNRPTLYVGGSFQEAGGVSASNIAAWNGLGWAPLGAGVDGRVQAIALHDDDGPDGPIGPALYVGGDFTHAGGLPSPYLARWGELPEPTCASDCDGSGDIEIFDWLCFVAAFNAKDPRADCNADGSFDLFDFLCFVNAFNAGC